VRHRKALWPHLLPPGSSHRPPPGPDCRLHHHHYQREEEARKAIVTLDGTINRIEEHRTAAEKEVTKIFDALAASLEERRVQVLQQMQDKGDQLRKTAIQEKDEAELATLQFREFHSFTEGLLAQGTPLEIVGTHKMVRA